MNSKDNLQMNLMSQYETNLFFEQKRNKVVYITTNKKISIKKKLNKNKYNPQISQI